MSQEKPDFVGDVLKTTAALKAEEWFYVVYDNEAVVYSPKPDSMLPPLNNPRDLLKVARALQGNPVRVDKIIRKFWRDYAGVALVQSHILVINDESEVTLNKTLYPDGSLVSPAMMFLAFIDSMKTGIPFAYLPDGINVLDEIEGEAVKKYCHIFAQKDKAVRGDDIDTFIEEFVEDSDPMGRLSLNFLDRWQQPQP